MPQAIVTGGAKRIGKAIALALAQAGYDIILTFKDSFDDAQKIAQEIRDMNRQCHLFRYNLAQKENVDLLFADISRKFDDITLLVNNASIFEKYSFMETSEQIFDAHMHGNFRSQFFLTQNFARYIHKKQYIENGNVINMLDNSIFGTGTSHFAYLLSKKSLYEFTKMVAKDLSPKIRVNSISLGRVLPESKLTTEPLDFTQYPRIKEITDTVIKLDSSKDTGTNIVIESDPQLV